MATLDDVLVDAYLTTLPTLEPGDVNTGTAIFKFWASHREVGTPVTGEISLDDGTVALRTATGRILHWLGGETVEVI